MNKNIKPIDTNKALIKTFNYEQNEYVLHTDINNVKYSLTSFRNYKKNVSIYLININKYKKLISLMYKFGNNFLKYLNNFEIEIKSDNYYTKTVRQKVKTKKGYKYEDFEDTKGYVYTLLGYNIKKSFLSYIIQNKKKIFNLFNYEDVTKIKKYRIENFCNQLNVNLFDVGIRKLKFGFYNVELYDVHNRKIINKQINVHHNAIYIDNVKYTFYYNDYNQSAYLYCETLKNCNAYDEFVTELTLFFQSINTTNDINWDEYLSNEAIKLMMMNSDSELKKLQQPLNNEE